MADSRAQLMGRHKKEPKPSMSSMNSERKLFCIHYSQCLNYAAKKNWHGFSCQGCKHFEPEPMESPAYWVGQAECCGRLLGEIFMGALASSSRKNHRVVRQAGR